MRHLMPRRRRCWRRFRTSVRSTRGGPLAPWLTRIATNKALDVIRAASRRPSPTDQPPGDTPGPAPGEMLETLDALQSLAPEARAMLVLSYLGGYSSAEVAEILDTNPGTVRSNMSRAKAQIERSTEVPR